MSDLYPQRGDLWNAYVKLQEQVTDLTEELQIAKAALNALEKV